MKENPDGTVNKFKARLVANGFLQLLGYDYNETISLEIKLVTVRLVLSLALINHWLYNNCISIKVSSMVLALLVRLPSCTSST